MTEEKKRRPKKLEHHGHWRPGQSGNPLGRIPVPLEIRRARRENFEGLFKMITAAFTMTQEESQKRLAGPEISQLEELVHRCIHMASSQGNAVYVKPLLEIFTIAAERVDDPVTAEDIDLLDKVRRIRQLPHEEKLIAIAEFLQRN